MHCRLSVSRVAPIRASFVGLDVLDVWDFFRSIFHGMTVCVSQVAWLKKYTNHYYTVLTCCYCFDVAWRVTKRSRWLKAAACALIKESRFLSAQNVNQNSLRRVSQSRDVQWSLSFSCTATAKTSQSLDPSNCFLSTLYVHYFPSPSLLIMLYTLCTSRIVDVLHVRWFIALAGLRNL